MQQGRGIVFPAVKFVHQQHSLVRATIRMKRELMRRLAEYATPVGGRTGLYAVRASQQEQLQTHTGAFARTAKDTLTATLTGEMETLREDFIRRFRDALLEFRARRPASEIDMPWIEAEAGKNFDDYMRADPFGVSIRYSVPLLQLGDPFDPPTQAIFAEKVRPGRVVAPARRTD